MKETFIFTYENLGARNARLTQTLTHFLLVAVAPTRSIVRVDW